MVKKISIMAVLVGLVIIFSFLTIYWINYTSPSRFLGKDQLIKKINHTFPEASVRTIQGTFYLDNRHVFVPFITSENNYGFSCWTWNKHKWEQTAINTIGVPFLWKINKKDSSTYRFIWNIHPNDNVSSIQFLFMRDRGYFVNNGIDHYEPKIQMRTEASVQKSYGFMKLPSDWITVMNSFYKVESEKQPDLLFANFFPQLSMYFGWISYDKKGKVAQYYNSVNGHGFGSYGDDLDDLRFLSGKDIE